MKRTSFFFAALLVLAALPLPAQSQDLRAYVGIVREQFSDEQVQFWNDLRAVLDKKKLHYLSTHIKHALKDNGFGSGFVYVAADGKNYVITNNHVVPLAAMATIEFENQATGELTKYEHLTLVAADEELDIALLAFPADVQPFTSGLTFSSSEVRDGDEVWAAGFPGFAASPLWQLGKGNVTNAKVRVKELLNPELSPVIQHSAVADPGNSGGPLLVEDSSVPVGYKVVGINTWKAWSRQAANYSIPAAAAEAFLRTTFARLAATAANSDSAANAANGSNATANAAGASAPVSTDSNAAANADLAGAATATDDDAHANDTVSLITKRAETLADGLNTNEHALDTLKRLISEQAACDGFTSQFVKQIYNNKTNRDAFEVLFYHYNLQSVRYYKAYTLWTQFNTIEKQNKPQADDDDDEDREAVNSEADANDVRFTVTAVEKRDDGYKVLLTTTDGARQLETRWLLERGEWKLSACDYSANSSSEAAKKHYDVNVELLLSEEPIDDTMPSPSNESFSFGMSYTKNKAAEDYDGTCISVDNFYGGFFSYDVWHAGWFNTGFGVNYQITEYDTLKLLDVHTGVRVPLYAGQLWLFPFAKAGLQATFLSDDFAGGYFYEGGAELALGTINKQRAFGVGASISYSRLYSANRNALNYKNCVGRLYMVIF